ncbi:MAG: DUF3472 domain-containing protein [Bacteroidaceae bacterium]|nr:DUF3472 domain-containing protein [Bacteroidaceae bacterium]
MKKTFLLLVALLSAMFRMIPAVAQNESVVTLAGNAYITASAQNNAEQWSGRGMRSAFIDEGRCAVRNWNDKETVISFYFRTANAGKMNLALQAKGNSTIEVSVLGKTKKVTLKSDELARYDLGKFKVKKEGYVRLDIRGLKINGGNDFGSVASVIVGGEVCPVVAVSQDFSTHFGRRGPSVHLGYSLPKENVEWFYNEVVVPEEGDIPSSYYMACGFGQGYFGMQNNTPSKRRILFSVWSPFETDNPADIPDSLRVTLVKKGANVTINDFGNEGSGGQSYMHYDWKPGERCRFLMGVRPDSNNSTVYTAYFYDNHQEKWVLVASFRRPKTSTWYTGAHSFLENFNPTMGYINRKAYYTNQWARTVNGMWVPVTKARFTCDATGSQRMRLDYKGGSDADKFYLSMGGFFDEYVKSGTWFERTGNVGEAPKIDFSTLE